MNKPAIRESDEEVLSTVESVEPSQSDQAPEPYTNYKSFEDAHIIPGQVTCEGYSPRHPIDLACHTHFPLNGENIKRHLNSCGGGFRFKVKKIKDRTSGFWKSLKDQSLEIQELRCDHCLAVVPLNATSINLHMIPHRGKNKQPSIASELLITFIRETTVQEEDQLDPFLANSY